VPRALITGITGQDGSYLAELLVEKGYDVHGIVRESSSMNRQRIDHLRGVVGTNGGGVTLHYGDLADSAKLAELVRRVGPDEVYNLGGQSHVKISFDLPELTEDVVGRGALRLLEAIRQSEVGSRFYQAGTSEVFGTVDEVPQHEGTRFRPRSPYACAKAYAHWITVNYREAYGMHASNGILFNHESPRRAENFVTRKITQGLARIVAGSATEIALGNLEVARDWGYARDYVEAMWLMLQQPEAGDYVIATGVQHTIRDFLDEAFGLVGIDWHDHVVQDPRFLRPTEVDLTVGNAGKAREQLGWEPRTTFAELVRLMVVADLELVGLSPADHLRR
jgi:GDPmannose 4,6-dehydratase